MHLQFKVGQLFASLFKGSPPEHVRVELREREVKISRHDMVYEDILATKVRTSLLLCISYYCYISYIRGTVEPPTKTFSWNFSSCI